MTQEGNLVTGEANYTGAITYKWVKTVNVVGNGTLDNEDGSGPVLLNDVIPTGAQLVEIKPSVAQTIEDDVKTQLVDRKFFPTKHLV